jgi:hypothetical protein
LPRRLTLLALAAFAFRLAFGLCSEFWFEDETQVFLLGLRTHATGQWPYFGPDIGGIRAQLPGALQALLVSLPMDVVPVPEAPFVLLNLLSLAALVGFAWYVRRRLPSLPAWLVIGWLLTAPWTLNFSTHVVNVSYLLPAGILFFIGALEALPPLRAGAIDVRAAHFLMGFALLCVVQLHMSWVVMAPFLLVALACRAREGIAPLARTVAWTAAGAALPGSLLVPTLWAHGLLAGGTEQSLRPEWLDPSKLVLIAMRFLSFASFEIVRFLGRSTARRFYFFSQHLWLAPFGAVLGLAGLAQPALMGWLWFKRNADDPSWRALKWTVLATVLFLYFSYFFASNKDPQAHAFYVVAPLAMVYAFHCFRQVDSECFRKVAAAVLVLGLVYHAGLAAARFKERSLYKNRRVVMAALRRNVPEILSHRRPFARDLGPAPPAERTPAFEAANEQGDLRITVEGWRRGAGGSSLFDLTIQHAGTAAAYRDLRYVTDYRSASGEPVRTGEGKVYEVIQPGQTLRLVAFNEGGVDARAARATFRLVGAEKLVPIPPGF